MNLKNIYIYLILVLSCCLVGCEKVETKPYNYPGYSSPETTFWTTFYAMQHKDSVTMLNALTPDYRLKYGMTEQEQLRTFEKDMNKIKIDKNRKRKIINVIYGKLDSYDAIIIWSETGAKINIKRSWVSFNKLNNEWKIAFSEQPLVNLFTLKPLNDKVKIDKIVSPDKTSD